ncbi:MAG: hypothetical protein RLZZ516_886 [Cyanobacteriota bacterium]|jgi:hypothetical protein
MTAQVFFTGLRRSHCQNQAAAQREQQSALQKLGHPDRISFPERRQLALFRKASGGQGRRQNENQTAHQQQSGHVR